MAKFSDRFNTLKSIKNVQIFSVNNRGSRDSRHFEIDKSARFAARGCQIFVAIASWYFIGKLGDPEIANHKLWPAVRYTWSLAVISPMVSVCLVAQYFVSCILRSWSSRKVLIFEMFWDVVISGLWVICLLYMAFSMGGDCPPGQSTNCTNFNWVLAWMTFSCIFWLAAVAFDVKGIFVGVFGFGGERLADSEMSAEIRRMGRTTGGRR